MAALTAFSVARGLGLFAGGEKNNQG